MNPTEAIIDALSPPLYLLGTAEAVQMAKHVVWGANLVKNFDASVGDFVEVNQSKNFLGRVIDIFVCPYFHAVSANLIWNILEFGKNAPPEQLNQDGVNAMVVLGAIAFANLGFNVLRPLFWPTETLLEEQKYNKRKGKILSFVGINTLRAQAIRNKQRLTQVTNYDGDNPKAGLELN